MLNLEPKYYLAKIMLPFFVFFLSTFRGFLDMLVETLFKPNQPVGSMSSNSSDKTIDNYTRVTPALGKGRG